CGGGRRRDPSERILFSPARTALLNGRRGAQRAGCCSEIRPRPRRAPPTARPRACLMVSRLERRWEAAAIFVLALVAREIWALLLPLDGGNDEIFHLYTARLTDSLGRLPALGADPGAAAFFHQVYAFTELPYLTAPPGAPLIAAAFLRLLPPGVPPYLWLRQLAVLGGALAALLAYLALRRLGPPPSRLPLAAALLLAIGPQFV